MDNWLGNIVSKQPDLSPDDKFIRDRFVDQYYLDNNPINALLRMGYTLEFSQAMSEQFMLDSYVLNRMEERKLEPGLRLKKLKEWISSELMSRAQYNGPGASEGAKIAALKTLIELHGLATPVKEKVKTENPGGVMQVPVYNNVNDWEQAAMKQQKELQVEH